MKCQGISFINDLGNRSLLQFAPRQFLLSMAVEFATVEAEPGISLSVRIYKPQSTPKDVTMVLVHQYAPLGGCQALMKGMASNLASRGYIVITFDTRGAGRSTGKSSWTGSSEVQDVVAVCKWAVQHMSSHKILLIGSSAGAPIAGSAVDQVEEVVGYVALGYPFGWLASVLLGRHNKPILESPKPKLFVMGTCDGFTSVKQLQNKLKNAAGQVQTHLVAGAGHFQMEGPEYDEEMTNLIVEFAGRL